MARRLSYLEPLPAKNLSWTLNRVFSISIKIFSNYIIYNVGVPIEGPIHINYDWVWLGDLVLEVADPVTPLQVPLETPVITLDDLHLKTSSMKLHAVILEDDLIVLG